MGKRGNYPISDSFSKLLDAEGKAIPMASVYAPFAEPYSGADQHSQELASWRPNLGSGNSDYLRGRNTMVARQRDLVRNSGWASGAVSRKLDNIIGASFRLVSRPDYRQIGQTPEWAHEFALEAQAGWRKFAEDPDNYVDATRHDNVNGLFGLAFRCSFVDGEAFAAAIWRDDKPSWKYKTAIQLIDADRISNPAGQADSATLRSGIETDKYGAAMAYHVRKGHPADWQTAMNAYTWERIERETPWGRRQMLHVFERERPDQLRGISPLAPIVERLKMVDKYDKVELQAAVMNAIFAAFIESPFDHDLLDGALSVEDPKLSAYQKQRSEYHSKRGITLNGVAIPKLFPGEKLGIQTAARPAAQFGEFEKACLRNIASGVGLSYEQLSQDWSSTNYSSARAALLEVWRGMARTRTRFAEQFATPIFILWMEEAISRGDLKLPAGAPDFYEGKGAYTRCRWIGPARGWVDPVKEGQAAQIRMDSLLSTLEDESAEQGKDYEETLDQIARENKMLAERGLTRPEWARQLGNAGKDAPAEEETNGGAKNG